MSSTNVALDLEGEAVLRRLMESKRYTSKEEILGKALALFESAVSAADEINDRIEAGWLSAERGELTDLDEAFAEFRADIDEKAPATHNA